MSKAITVGKFWPFHKGHEFMIQTALDVFGSVTVLIDGKTREETDFAYEAIWYKFCKEEANFQSTGLNLVTLFHDLPDGKKDENGTYVDENRLSYNDFHNILHTQISMINSMEKESNSLVFTDTEAITTHMYIEPYIGKYSNIEEFKYAFQFNNIDYYILLTPGVNWVDDGTRIMPDQKKRWEFFDEMRNHLIKLNKNYDIVYGDNYHNRQKRAEQLVQNFINNRK